MKYELLGGTHPSVDQSIEPFAACDAPDSSIEDSSADDSLTEDSLTEDSSTEDSLTEDSSTEDSSTEDDETLARVVCNTAKDRVAALYRLSRVLRTELMAPLFKLEQIGEAVGVQSRQQAETVEAGATTRQGKVQSPEDEHSAKLLRSIDGS